MEFYLIRISYTSGAWAEMLDKAPSLDQRLGSVRKLLVALGGSLATHRFYDLPHYAHGAQGPIVVNEKFASLGEHDVIALACFPERAAAAAFNAVVLAEPGIRIFEMLPIMPLEEMLGTLGTAKQACASAGYAVPGRQPPAPAGATA